MLESNENKPNTENDNSLIEQKMKTLVEQLAKNSEFVENNLIVIQKVETKIDDMSDVHHKTFLKLLYGQQKYKKDFAFASLMKGTLVQNRLFFAFARDTLVEMVKIDPDIPNKGQSFDMKPFCALLAENGICQLWDAVVSAKKSEQRVAGYVVVNPAIRDLLKVDKHLALEQFKELKKLSGNDWVTEDMVFDSCGELRVSIDDHRVLVEGRRTKSSEPRGMNDDSGVSTKEVGTLIDGVKGYKSSTGSPPSVEPPRQAKGFGSRAAGRNKSLHDVIQSYFNNEKLGLLNSWLHGFEYPDFLNTVRKSHKNSYVKAMSETTPVTQVEFIAALESHISHKCEKTSEDIVAVHLELGIENHIFTD